MRDQSSDQGTQEFTNVLSVQALTKDGKLWCIHNPEKKDDVLFPKDAKPLISVSQDLVDFWHSIKVRLELVLSLASAHAHLLSSAATLFRVCTVSRQACGRCSSLRLYKRFLSPWLTNTPVNIQLPCPEYQNSLLDGTNSCSMPK